MIDLNKPVRVFKNLKHGCYSILQDGRVKASARQVRLADVEFRIRESGRQRMLREERRIVHAFAVGRLVEFLHPSEPGSLEALPGRTVRYDPHRFATFFDGETGDPVMGADLVQLDEGGAVYA